MLDGLSIDQLRIFIAASESDSFSAAARKLHRAQSVVSQTVANLERQIGVALFDRSGRVPVLTQEGRVLLADARAVVSGMDEFKARAKSVAQGLEAELAVAMDILFPAVGLAAAVRTFTAAYPEIPLRLHVEMLGAAIEPVMKGDCSFGVAGSLPTLPSGVVAERLFWLPMVMVAAASHPLAGHNGIISKGELSRHIQLVVTDRSSLSGNQQFGVMSSKVWLLTDFATKQAFLREGLGFGGMPLHLVADEIAARELVELEVEDKPVGGMFVAMTLFHLADNPPGRAGRFLIENLKHCAGIKTAE